MFFSLETFTYLVTVILALGLLSSFGVQHWYWHALSVAAGFILGMTPVRHFEPLFTPLSELVLGNLIVFLMAWGICAPFFRHHHLPVHHH
jgi:hypothetical protein